MKQTRRLTFNYYKPDGPSLSGWLSKIVNGNKAAEAQVEFDLIEGVD